MKRLINRFQSFKLVSTLRAIKNYHTRKIHQDKKDKYGYEIIKKVDEIGHKCGLKMWIEWGTLLGLVREGQLIGHDYDVDFATHKISDNQYIKLVGHLERNGFRRTRQFIYKGDIVSETYDYQGTLVDIDYCEENDKEFLYLEYDIGEKTTIEKKSGKYYYNQMDVLIYHVTKFGLKRGTFSNGVTCSIPDNVENHLEFLYGKDWRIPDPNFEYRSIDNFELIESDRECSGWREM